MTNSLPDLALAQRQALTVEIRWLIRRDMPEVLAIETACFEFPWSEEDFLCRLRQRNCIGMVAEQNSEILGFMVYEFERRTINLLNFAVAPNVRRHSIGTQMVQRLVEKLQQQNRNEIVLAVRESYLRAQFFFKSQGFRAVQILRHHYDDTNEDAYVMQYQRATAQSGNCPFALTNRLTGYFAP